VFEISERLPTWSNCSNAWSQRNKTTREREKEREREERRLYVFTKSLDFKIFNSSEHLFVLPEFIFVGDIYKYLVLYVALFCLSDIAVGKKFGIVLPYSFDKRLLRVFVESSGSTNSTRTLPCVPLAILLTVSQVSHTEKKTYQKVISYRVLTKY
jgi:hypothetical protein